MATAAKQIEWCTVRLGDDMNWWVIEVSDDIHWDVDGLSIIDPRQMSHILDLVEPLRDYSFDQDLLDLAFIPFRIQKDLGDGLIRLVRTKESFFDAEEALFALPNVVDEENSPYADFTSHITRARVKLLNDMIDFEQNLTVDEVEDTLHEEENNSFIEGRAIHLFSEVTTILDYVPNGWELDEDVDATSVVADEGDLNDLPDIEEEDTSALSKDKSLKWDEDEEDKDEDLYEGGPPDGEEEEEELSDDEEEEED